MMKIFKLYYIKKTSLLGNLCQKLSAVLLKGQWGKGGTGFLDF